MKNQWADSPLPLIETPRHKLGPNVTQSEANKVATDMAQIHNVMIRGINSMSIQAPLITTAKDISDFIDYALSFCVLIREHHNTEEVLIFPLIEDATGVPGIMDRNVVQHETFLPKMHEFKNYLSQMKLGVREYDAKKFVALLDSFKELMVEHLRDEVKMLAEMDKFDIDWKTINERTTKHAIETADKYQEFPFVLVNMDVTYEDKMHVGVWPPIPWFVHLIARWFWMPKFKGAWRFGSCDALGRPKELEFVRTS